MKTGIHIKSCTWIFISRFLPQTYKPITTYISPISEEEVFLCAEFPSLCLRAVQFPSPPSFQYISSIGFFCSSYKYAQVPPKKNREHTKLLLSAYAMFSFPSGFPKMIYPPRLYPLTSPFTPQITAAGLSVLPPIPNCKIPRPSLSPYLTWPLFGIQ